MLGQHSLFTSMKKPWSSSGKVCLQLHSVFFCFLKLNAYGYSVFTFCNDFMKSFLTHVCGQSYLFLLNTILTFVLLPEMINLTTRLCWKFVKKDGYIAIWQKPTNNDCYLSRDSGVKPSLCDVDDDPDKVWYV